MTTTTTKTATTKTATTKTATTVTVTATKTTKTATTTSATKRKPVITTTVANLEDINLVLHNLFEGAGLDDANAADIVDAIESKLNIDAVAKSLDHDLASLIEHAAVVEVLDGFDLSEDTMNAIAAAASQGEEESVPSEEEDSAITAAVSTLVTLSAVAAAFL